MNKFYNPVTKQLDPLGEDGKFEHEFAAAVFNESYGMLEVYFVNDVPYYVDHRLRMEISKNEFWDTLGRLEFA